MGGHASMRCNKPTEKFPVTTAAPGYNSEWKEKKTQGSDTVENLCENPAEFLPNRVFDVYGAGALTLGQMSCQDVRVTKSMSCQV